MREGKLYANTNYSNYMLGSFDGPDVSEGQAVEVLLGGHWIGGHIEYSHPYVAQGVAGRRVEVAAGAYQVPDEGAIDSVTRASELSFPASDPPAYDDEKPLAKVVGGYYFKADADGSVCGLCVGMQLRM